MEVFWYNIIRTIESAHSRAVWLTPDRKGVVPMTTFEALMLMLTFGLLIVAMLSQDKKK